MARKKKEIVENQEVLNAEITVEEHGEFAAESEHPAVKDLVSDKFVDASDVEAAKIARAVYQLIAGELSTEFDERFKKYLAFADARDKEAQKWEEDRQKWFEEQMERANKLRAVSEYDKGKVMEETQRMMKKAQQQAAAENAEEKLRWMARLRSEPKETITSFGIPKRGRNGRFIEPESISLRVGGSIYRFTLEPGKPTELPRSIAQMFRQRYAEAAELNKLNQDLAFDTAQDFNNVAAKHPEVDPRGGVAMLSGNELLETIMAESKKGADNA